MLLGRRVVENQRS